MLKVAESFQVTVGFVMQLLAYKHEGKAKWSKASASCRQLAGKPDRKMVLQQKILSWNNLPLNQLTSQTQ